MKTGPASLLLPFPWLPCYYRLDLSGTISKNQASSLSCFGYPISSGQRESN